MEEVMFQRIRDYKVIDMSGLWYRPRAYGDPQSDGTWDGWLVFFPLAGGAAVAPERETTRSTFDELVIWAAGLTPVYLEGALARALRIAHQPHVVARLEDSEYEALEDAERLEAAAEIERLAADIDETAAAEARLDAEQIRRERLTTESVLAATEQAAATRAAEAHEEADVEARAVANDAARRSGAAKAGAAGTARPKRRSGKKK